MPACMYVVVEIATKFLYCSFCNVVNSATWGWGGYTKSCKYYYGGGNVYGLKYTLPLLMNYPYIPNAVGGHKYYNKIYEKY